MTDLLLFVLLVIVAGVLLWTTRGRIVSWLFPASSKDGSPARNYYWKLARQAGLSPDGTWPVYLGTKIVLALVLPLLAAGLSDFGWWALLCGAVTGFFLPDAGLAYVRRKRQDAIRRALSFFLDLLVSLLQAGLSLEEAFTRTARSGLPKAHPLSREAAQVVDELDLGRERGLGFQALADRTGLVEIRGLATALQLGFSLGASVETTLKAQADLARAKRREEGLKRVNVVSAEVLLPLVLCSFPVFVVLVIVPLGIRVLESLAGFRNLLR